MTGPLPSGRASILFRGYSSPPIGLEREMPSRSENLRFLSTGCVNFADQNALHSRRARSDGRRWRGQRTTNEHPVRVGTHRATVDL